MIKNVSRMKQIPTVTQRKGFFHPKYVFLVSWWFLENSDTSLKIPQKNATLQVIDGYSNDTRKSAISQLCLRFYGRAESML